MTTAREAGYIPGDLAVCAYSGDPRDTHRTDARLIVGRVTAINAPSVSNPESLVTKMRVLWESGDLFLRGQDQELSGEFEDFIIDDDLGAHIDLMPQSQKAGKKDTRLSLGELITVAKQNTWNDREVPEEVMKETLAQEGAIDRLVASGRSPLFLDFIVGYGADHRGEMTFCIIPPHGTKSGDFIQRHEGGSYEFLSPRYESRGLARLVVYTRAEAAELEEKVDIAREKVKSS